jgi:hypothetical protein
MISARSKAWSATRRGAEAEMKTSYRLGESQSCTKSAQPSSALGPKRWKLGRMDIGTFEVASSQTMAVLSNSRSCKFKTVASP